MKNFANINLVIVFELQFKDKVLEFLNAHPFKQLIGLYEDKESICLVINETKTDNIYAWLNKMIEIVDYTNHQAFYQLSSGNIFHLYLSAKNHDDEFDLKFSAEHLSLFWQLNVIIDVDYDVGHW